MVCAALEIPNIGGASVHGAHGGGVRAAACYVRCPSPPCPNSAASPLLRNPLQAYDNAKSIKGKSQAAVLAAIVFLACRHTGNARTFKEICAVVPQASVKVGGQAGSGTCGWHVHARRRVPAHYPRMPAEPNATDSMQRRR